MERRIAVAPPTRRERARIRRQRFRRVRALLAGGLVLGVGATATLAAWTDQEYATTTVQAGTFGLVSRTSAADPFVSHGGGSESQATLAFTATGMYPGVSTAAWIQVKTSGTLGGTLQLTGVGAPATAAPDIALRNAMKVRVSVSAATGSDAVPACTTSTPGTEVTGLQSIPALPPQTLAGGGATTVTYCLVLTLPADAPADAQGGAVSPTWTFTGSTG